MRISGTGFAARSVALAAQGGLALTAALPLSAWAQDYPTRPIRFVTSAAGGAGDFVSRTMAQAVTGPLGQPVVVPQRLTVFRRGP